MRAEAFINDIDERVAQAAHEGTSFVPERRGQQERESYASTMAGDYATLRSQAEKGGTLDMLDEEFSRYRQGYARLTRAYLHSSGRCVSSWIAGPSNFPARRMQKRMDVTHRRLTELCNFRVRALAAIRRKLRPDLRAIYAGDSDAIDRLVEKLARAEDLQRSMRNLNAIIRREKKNGEQAQIAALVAAGLTESRARDLLKPDFAGRIGFADFELKNNGANIRRMEQRLDQITARRQEVPEDIQGELARLEVAPAENRVRLYYPSKPDAGTIAELKRNGFRWSPSLGAWSAYYNKLDVARRFAGQEAK